MNYSVKYYFQTLQEPRTICECVGVCLVSNASLEALKVSIARDADSSKSVIHTEYVSITRPRCYL